MLIDTTGGHGTVMKSAILFGLLVIFLGAKAWGLGDCGDPRATSCKPGQWLNTDSDRSPCVACPGNTISDGCSRTCGACGTGTVANADHSKCDACSGNTIAHGSKCVPCASPTVPDPGHSVCVQPGCDARGSSCNPGQWIDTNTNNQCRACTGNTISSGCTRDCSPCASDALANAGHTVCVPFPPGTYRDNSKPVPFGGGCQPVFMDGDTLIAFCPDYLGLPRPASLADANECPANKHDIENVDGELKCVLSSTKSPNGHGDVFDIISKSLGVDSEGNQVIHWQIDHPNVSQQSTRYPGITFQQGDAVKVEAGGCVHTNGGFPGQRWKKYVNPYVDRQAENPTIPFNLYDAIYAGGLNIQAIGVNTPPLRNEPFEIAMALQRPGGFTVPGSGSSSYPKQFDLSLLYYDSDFSQNGYYSHDDGTNAQCVGHSPAWVNIEVVTPRKPIAYTGFKSGKNFDLAWRTDRSGVDDNGLPLNPLWSYQVENPGQVPNVQTSCAPNSVFDRASPACTSQPTTMDENTDVFLENFSYCDDSDTLYPGHINWRIATYTGALYYRAWSGSLPNDDDMNFGLETDGQAGQTAVFEGPDTGIGVEFKNSETTANYTTTFWKAIDQNATSAGQLISVSGNHPNEFANGEYAVVTGLMGIDAVHKGYSELHPVYALAIKVVWNPLPDGGMQETWAFFIRNSGTEGSCASLGQHHWASKDSTYSIQLPWPRGATSVKVVSTTSDGMERSSTDQEFLGAEGFSPWTYLRFKLPTYTQTGMDGEITLQYDGATSRNVMLACHAKTSGARDTTEETEYGMNWIALSARIADPAVRQKFLSEVNAAMQANSSTHPKVMTALPIEQGPATFTHKQDFGAWINEPATDVVQPNAEKQKQADAVKAVIAKYSKDLNLPQASPGK